MCPERTRREGWNTGADKAPWLHGVGVSRETRAALEEFVPLLERWTEKLKLIGRADRNAIWSRHIRDSLQLLPFLEHRPAPFIDLGSGAGFPGLVLAIASGQHFHLIESDRRKAAFLREAARVTAAPVTVHPRRIEVIALSPASVVTARALAPLPKLLTLALPLLQPEGILLALKGKTAQQELTAAQAQWQMRVVVTPSCTDAAASILQISALRAA
jgi:16S rRNA (guanine(527)-N(7))-methyltransferase RsmG